MLNSVVEISAMSVKYFEYYTIILRGAVFSWTHWHAQESSQTRARAADHGVELLNYHRSSINLVC